MRREWKPDRPKHRGPVEPDRTILLTACARELLTTWEHTKDKALIDRHLARVDKTYGPGSERLVRQLMHKVKADERHG